MLSKILEDNLISDRELADASLVSVRTVINAKKQIGNLRITTKKKLWTGLNEILKTRGDKPIPPSEIF